MTEYDEEAYAWYVHDYSTHRPFLEAYVRRTTGDVIEFGAGYGSTGFLRNLLEGTGRKLISIEDHPEWLENVKQAFPETEFHRYIGLTRTPDHSHWDAFLSTFKHDRPISIIFIDQTSWEKRALTCQTLKDNTEYIIIHDADYLPRNGLLGSLKDPSRPLREESNYDFTSVFGSSYKLYFPPSPWTEEHWGPPTLVGTRKDLPILSYDHIDFHF